MRSPRRFACLLAALAAAPLLAAGCATLGGANYVSIEEEWELGRQLEADINQQLRLVSDPTLERYVEQLGQQLVRETEMANRPWRFHVVADDAINAFNIPGGVVYVNTGLIAQAGSASELAGAMAHEVAHGVSRHGTQRLSQAYEANLLAGILLGGNPGLVEQIAAQVVAQGAFARFSRADEREADQLAVPYMAGAGWDPEGLARLLERLVGEGGGGGGIPLFATHPAPAERARDVRALARGYAGRESDNQFSAMRQRAARF
jgi:predicted Zn-dependent protease